MNNYQQSLARIASFNASKVGHQGVNISNTNFTTGHFGVGALISNSVAETEEYLYKIHTVNSIREQGSCVAERLRKLAGKTAHERAHGVYSEYLAVVFGDKKIQREIISSACEDCPELNVRCFTIDRLEIQALSKDGRVLYTI